MREPFRSDSEPEIPAIRRAGQIYGWLLLLYPARFRHEYGREMRLLFRDRCRDAYRQNHFGGLIKTWLGVAVDLLCTAGAERISSLKGKIHMLHPFTPGRHRWVPVALIAAGAITSLLAWFQPRFYASTNRLAVATSESQATPSSDPFWFQIESEKIKSRAVLDKVASQLNLAKHWAERGILPAASKYPAVYAVLSRRIELRRYRSTSLIEIRVQDEDPQLAAAIANSVSENYCALRRETAAGQRGLELLKEELKLTDSRIEKAAGQMKTLRAEIDGKSSEMASLEWVQIRQEQAERADREHRQLTHQLAKLKQLDASKLTEVLAVVSPDPQLSSLLARRQQGEVDLTALRQNFSDGHPEVKKALALEERLQSQIEERISGMLTGMDLQAESLDQERSVKTKAWQEARERYREVASRQSELAQVNQDLVSERQTRQALQAKIAEIQVANAQRSGPQIECVDRAEPGLRCVPPNWPGVIYSGLLGGMIIGLAYASFCRWRKLPIAGNPAV